MRFVLPYVSTSLLLSLKIDFAMDSKINWFKVALEVIKFVATLLLGYFGGNAVV